MPFPKDICSAVDKLIQKNKITFNIFNFLSLKNILSIHHLDYIFSMAIPQGCQNAQIVLFLPKFSPLNGHLLTQVS